MVEFSVKTSSFEFLLRVEAALMRSLWYKLQPLLWIVIYQLGTNAQLQSLITKLADVLYRMLTSPGLF